MTAGAWEADLAFIRRSLEILATDASWRVNGRCDPNGVNFDGQSIAQRALERLAYTFSVQSTLSEALQRGEMFREALGQIVVADTHLTWTGGAVPEPSHEEYGSCAEIARAALENQPVALADATKEDALSAKDRELAEARERCQMWFDTHDAHRKACDALGKANGELMKRAMDAERRATTAERERDEAMAALREKEEALAAAVDRAFEDAKFAAAEVRPKNDRMDWTEFAKIRDACVDGVIAEIMKAQARARSVLSSVQPVPGSREQRGNEEG